MITDTKDTHSSTLEEILGDVMACWCRNNYIYDTWASLLGLTPCQMLVLYALTRLPDSSDTNGNRPYELCQRDISEGLGMSKQTVNCVMRDLVKEGLIYTAPSKYDGRTKTINFTEKGKKYAMDTLAPLLEVEQEIFASINPEHLEIFVHVQKQVVVLMTDRLNSVLKTHQRIKPKSCWRSGKH